MNPEEIVMYIILNEDAKMSKGKLVAQGGHAVHLMIRSLEDSRNSLHPPQQQLMWYAEWHKGSYVKIAAKAPESLLKKLIAEYPPVADWYSGLPEYQKFWTMPQVDEGRTELPKGTLASLAFNPAPRNKLPQELSGLQLL